MTARLAGCRRNPRWWISHKRVAADHAWPSDSYGVQGTVMQWSHDVTHGVAGVLTASPTPG